MKHHPVIIVGAGPAGLTAAYELVKRGIKPLVLEKADKVGGISRTETYKGYRFDIGGHRFFTKVEEVTRLWYEVLGNDFIKVPRMSRIYYQGKFFNYPLEIFDTLSNLGIVTSALMVLSYLKIRIRPLPVEETLEQWVTNRFGGRLFQAFFRTYTEKVWGIPCDQIQADWAAQRIKGLSLKKAIVNALFGSNDTKTLIKEFDYPRLGPGMMWENFQARVDEQGGEVQLNTGVVQFKRQGKKITSAIVQKDGHLIELTADHYISSMPVTALIHRLDPPAPSAVIEAANSLNYRAFIIVSLVINQPKLFPDNWIYIHSADVKVGRIQNFKNWSPEMVPDPTKTCLGLEYFCNEGDELWNLSDAELLDLATEEIEKLGLANQSDVEDGVVIRQPKAYPVYDQHYRQHLQVIQDYLSEFDNLQTIGRNGMHRYNNQDHSMLTGMLAASNLMGEDHDLWDVNTERSYHEEFVTKSQSEKRPTSKV
ncbi:amine oxidase [Leptolyngbya sp. NIES-3755]|nr:amine oxidase [Leptolyngbya sp. NIES-3755]